MKHLCRFRSLLLVTVVLLGAGTLRLAADDQPQLGDVSVAVYASIQAAVDANPSRMVYVPAGDYPISAKIRIYKDRSGLYGPGRIIQQNPEQPIIEIENSADVEVRDLNLTRPEGNQDTSKEGILSINCRHLVIDNVRVVDNRTVAAAISLRDCVGARISRCLVRNYMRVSVDDRTADANWGHPACPFDEATALESVGGDRELLGEIIDAFFEELPLLTAALATALQHGDAPTAHRAAHTLKGSLSTLGASEASSLAQQIETRARAGDCAVDTLHSALLTSLTRFTPALTEYRRAQ